MISFRPYTILMASCLIGWVVFGYLALRENSPASFTPAYIQKNETLQLEFVGQQNMIALPGKNEIAYWDRAEDKEGRFLFSQGAPVNLEGSQIQPGCFVVFLDHQFVITQVLDSGMGKVKLNGDAVSGKIQAIHALNIEASRIGLNSFLVQGRPLGKSRIDIAITEDVSETPSHAAISRKFNTPYWAMSFTPGQSGYLESLDLLLKNDRGDTGIYFLSIHRTDISGAPQTKALHTQEFSAKNVQDSFQDCLPVSGCKFLG